MPGVQKRRAVSLSPAVYQALATRAEAEGVAVAGLAEALLRQALGLPVKRPRAAYRRAVVPTFSRLVRRDA